MYVSAYSKYMLEKLLRDLQETWMRSGHLYNEEIKKSTNSKNNLLYTSLILFKRGAEFWWANFHPPEYWV